MRKCLLAWISLMLFGVIAFAQEKEPILFTVDGREVVSAMEFKAVYNKNRDIGEEIDPKTPAEYLELYIDFKLKVLEAKDSAMDERPGFIREFESYRSQLAKPYLTDQRSEEDLVQEAYERMQYDIKASHIMISLNDPNDPEDTARAFNQLKEVEDRLNAGDLRFEEAARDYSDDTYSAQRGGSLGFFSVFDMVYPFENNVYKLEVGQRSPIFRTQFGYHIARLDDKRPARGKIQVAHLMVKLPENADQNQKAEAERKIRELHAKLTNGEASFEELVVQFSDDNTSKAKNGRLPEFGINDMVEPFENASYALQSSGDYSEPVRTPYGWHIIKLIEKKPLPPLEEIIGDLRNKIKRDARVQTAQESFIRSLLKQYDYKVNDENLNALAKEIENEELSGGWDAPEKLRADEREVATYADKKLLVKDLVDYMVTNRGNFPSKVPRRAILDAYMEMLMEKLILDYEKSQLERKYPEYRLLVNEYRDGILLFDLTDKKIWSRSMRDTTGLQAFFEAHRDQYLWKKRYDYTIYDCSSKKVAKKIRKALLKGAADSSLLAEFNEESALNLSISGKVEEIPDELINSLEETPGISKIEKRNGRFVFVKLNEILEPRRKELKEVRGLVAADYQKQLEAAWVEELRARYPVEINDEVKQQTFKELAD